MDRRDFMRKACEAGAGGMLILASAGSAHGRSEEQGAAKSAAQAAQEACEKDREFSREWIMNMAENIDGELDEKTKILLLEECGRSCARKGATAIAVEAKGDLEKFLSVYRGWIGDRNVLREGNTVTIVYDKCYCPNVRDAEKVPAIYCHCSRGWVREMLETVTGKPCDVTLITSIKRGDKECKLSVRV